MAGARSGGPRRSARRGARGSARELAFLGSRPVEEVEQIATAVGGAVGGLPAASLAALAARPVPRRRPRLFALDLSDGGGRAGAVHAAVSAALGEGGFYSPERRAFWPHVTVARVGRAERSLAPLSLPPPGEPFMADEVVLYRSHLGGGPARYEALERWRLRRV